MKAVEAAFNQEKALVGSFSVITNLRLAFVWISSGQSGLLSPWSPVSAPRRFVLPPTCGCPGRRCPGVSSRHSNSQPQPRGAAQLFVSNGLSSVQTLPNLLCIATLYVGFVFLGPKTATFPKISKVKFDIRWTLNSTLRIELLQIKNGKWTQFIVNKVVQMTRSIFKCPHVTFNVWCGNNVGNDVMAHFC